MPERNPIETTNLDIYGNVELPWSRARDLLAAEPSSRIPGGESVVIPRHGPPRWSPPRRRRRGEQVRR